MTSPDRAGHRRGFTLLETLLAIGLTTLLMLVLSAAWAGFARPATTTVARCRVAQEASMAVAALSGDLGGYLADSPGRLGGTTLWPLVGRMAPARNQLWLCFDGGGTPNGSADWKSPDAVITYELQGTQLVRTNQLTGATFMVANDLQALSVQDLGSGLFEIKLTFVYRDVTQTFTLQARDP